MTLPTDSAFEDALSLLAAEESLPRQEVIRLAVLERAKKVRRETALASLTAEAVEAWSETLDRLGRK